MHRCELTTDWVSLPLGSNAKISAARGFYSRNFRLLYAGGECIPLNVCDSCEDL
jgi:hypothetical protein